MGLPFRPYFRCLRQGVAKFPGHCYDGDDKKLEVDGLERKKLLRWGGGAVLALLFLGVFAFLQLFTRAESAFTILEWRSAAALSADGAERPLDMDPLYQSQPELGPGEWFLFRTTLPPLGGDEELLLEISGAETALFLDGTLMLRSGSLLPEGAFGLGQVQLPLPPDAAGKTVELRCRPLEGESLGIFPPLLRLEAAAGQDAENIAYANLYGMPAAALAVVFLLICFLFLAGLLAGTPDRSLPVLALAAAIMSAHQLATGLGYHFLPPGALSVLIWPGFEYLVPALLLTYFALNRKRAFWRRLGWCSLWAALLLGAAWLLSLAGGGYLARYLHLLLEDVAGGYIRNLLYWVTVYLVLACAGIAAWGVMEAIARARAEASALALKAELSVQNLQAIEKNDREVAALHHELKHHLTALQAMYRAGQQEEMGAYLARLSRQMDELPKVRFTENITVNAILQDAAARAAEGKISFHAAAAIPAQLPIPAEDLCCLLMNLLDNALEAAVQVPVEGDRFIRFHCHIKGGFLGVKCENSFAGMLDQDADTGKFRSTKPDADAHGFGMKQMQNVAEKYHSLLVVSYTDTVFTAQTALSLPDQP